MHFFSTKMSALTLYREIKRLHRKLPKDVRFLGDEYIKSEFQRHKNCDPVYIPAFFSGWNQYKLELEKQIETKNLGARVDIESFSDEQVGQLYELKNAIKF